MANCSLGKSGQAAYSMLTAVCLFVCLFVCLLCYYLFLFYSIVCRLRMVLLITIAQELANVKRHLQKKSCVC